MNDSMPTTEQSVPVLEKKPRFAFLRKIPWYIVLLTIVLIGVICIFLYRYFNRTTPTPLETLQDLRESSVPLTQPDFIRSHSLKKVETTSKPYRPSKEVQLQMLEKLEQ